MEISSFDQKDYFASVAHYLTKAESCLLSCDWPGVLDHCRAYLQELPLDRFQHLQHTTQHLNFHRLAKNMLAANHTFESVMQLVEWKQNLLDVIEPFFSDLGKKGVHLPAPIPGPHESRFVFESVMAYHKLIMYWMV